jgi:hypothetical protein
MRFAIIRGDHVVNVVEAAPGFEPGDGCRAMPSPDASPGWRFDGEGFAPAAPEADPPRAISMFQAREALRNTPAPGGDNLLAAAQAVVDEARDAQPTLALAWEYATQIDRDGALVAALASRLGLDGPAIDDLFRRAGAVGA